MRPFRTSLIRLFSTAALLAVTANVAAARDYCVTSDMGTIVLQKFHLPKPNTCRPVYGFHVTQLESITGTACATADGGFVNITINAGVGLYASNLRGGTISLPLPSMSGGDSTVVSANGGTGTVTRVSGVGTASAEPCPFVYSIN